MAKKRLAHTPPIRPVDPDTEYNDLLGRVKPPLLSLEEIVIKRARMTNPGEKPFSVHGTDLARLLSFLEAHNNLAHTLDAGDVNLRLRGLAELLRAENYCLGENAAFFVANTLDDLAARLETHHEGDLSAFRVGLLTAAPGKKAVAS